MVGDWKIDMDSVRGIGQEQGPKDIYCLNEGINQLKPCFLNFLSHECSNLFARIRPTISDCQAGWRKKESTVIVAGYPGNPLFAGTFLQIHAFHMKLPNLGESTQDSLFFGIVKNIILSVVCFEQKRFLLCRLTGRYAFLYISVFGLGRSSCTF